MDTLYTLSRKELKTLLGLSPERAQLVYDGLCDLNRLDKELELIERHDITLLTLADAEYPSQLKNIAAPPTVLYIQGAASLSHAQQLAVVGSRKADHYGQQVINALIPELVQHGLAITSGGALGLDGMAHLATLSAKGLTLAVLGSGLLKPYPSRHKSLFKTIVEQGGAVVSPFPLTYGAVAGNVSGSQSHYSWADAWMSCRSSC